MRHSKQILSHTKSPTKKSKKFNIPCTWNVRPLYVRVCAFIPNAGKCSNVNWYQNKRMQGNMRSPIHACIYPSACTSNFMGATCGCLPRKSECKQGNRKKSKLLWIYFANKTANTHTHTFVYTISIIMNMNNSRLSRGTMLVGVDASRYIFINWRMLLNLFKYILKLNFLIVMSWLAIDPRLVYCYETSKNSFTLSFDKIANWQNTTSISRKLGFVMYLQ